MNHRPGITEELPLRPNPAEELICTYLVLVGDTKGFLEQYNGVPEVANAVQSCIIALDRFSNALQGFYANAQSGSAAYFQDFDRSGSSGRSIPVSIAVLHAASWVDRRFERVKRSLSALVLHKARVRCVHAINSVTIDSNVPQNEASLVQKMVSADSLSALKTLIDSGGLSLASANAARAAFDGVFLDKKDPVLAINNLLDTYIRTAEQRHNVAVAIDISEGRRKFEAVLELLPRYAFPNRPVDQSIVYTITLDTNEKPILIPGTDDVFGIATMINDRKYLFQIRKKTAFARREGTAEVDQKVIFEVVGVVPATKAEQKYFRSLNKHLKAQPEAIDVAKPLECIKGVIFLADDFNISEANKLTVKKVQSLAIAHRRTIGGLALVGSLALAAIAVRPSFEGRHQTSATTARARSAAPPHESHTTLSNRSIDASNSMDTGSIASVDDVPYIDANDVEEVVDASSVTDVATVSPAPLLTPTVPVVSPLPSPTTGSAYGTLVDGFNVAHSYQANAEFAVRHILTSNPSLLSGTHLTAATIANYWASLRPSSPLQTARHDSSTGVLRHTNVGDRFELYRQDNGSFNLIQLRGSTQNRVIHVDSLLDGKNAANDELRSSQGHTSITPEALPDSGRASYDASEIAHLDNVYMSPDSMDYQQIVPAHHVASYTARESSAKQSAAQRPARGLWGRVKSFFGFGSKTQHKRYIDQDSAEYRTMIADRTDNTYADPETARRLITNHTAKPRSWLSKLVQSLFR